MQVNVSLFAKNAVEAALQKDWKKAVELNKQILEKTPNDKDAHIRLGRAYIKTEEFSKAKKIFKKILETDPINSIALKNYKLASENDSDSKGGKVIGDVKNLIREPGTSTQVKIPVPAMVIKRYKLETGDILGLKINKNSTIVFAYSGNKTDNNILGKIEDSTARRLHNAKVDNKKIIASFVKANGETITLLIKCNHPIFKSEKQQEKPYMKRDVLDEPDLDMSTPEEESEMVVVSDSQEE